MSDLLIALCLLDIALGDRAATSDERITGGNEDVSLLGRVTASPLA
jgi:hypothetical protein